MQDLIHDQRDIKRHVAMHAIKNGCSIKAILLLCNGCNTPFAEGQRVVDAGSFCIRCKRYIERVFCCIVCCTKWKKKKKNMWG